MNELKDAVSKAIEAKQQHVNQLLKIREKAIDTLTSTQSELQFANASLEKLHSEFKQLHELEYQANHGVGKVLADCVAASQSNAQKPN